MTAYLKPFPAKPREADLWPLYRSRDTGVRCRGYGWWESPLNDERVQVYEMAACRRAQPMERAVRAAAGLAHLARLTKLWNRKKRKRVSLRQPKPRKQNNVVPIRRRA